MGVILNEGKVDLQIWCVQSPASEVRMCCGMLSSLCAEGYVKFEGYEGYPIFLTICTASSFNNLI